MYRAVLWKEIVQMGFIYKGTGKWSQLIYIKGPF